MAVDSIIAKPTNNVRVMVAEASGCCASEVSAVATARPSPSAGPMQPKPVVRPAVTIEATAMRVMLSIMCVLLFLIFVSSFGRWSRLGLASARGGRDVNRCQDGKDVGLNHAGQQTQCGHDNRKEERR